MSLQSRSQTYERINCNWEHIHLNILTTAPAQKQQRSYGIKLNPLVKKVFLVFLYYLIHFSNGLVAETKNHQFFLFQNYCTSINFFRAEIFWLQILVEFISVNQDKLNSAKIIKIGSTSKSCCQKFNFSSDIFVLCCCFGQAAVQ